MSHYIQLIKNAGFRVFIRGPLETATYCYYTDGMRIAYAQWGSMCDIGTYSVQLPNMTSGTGFKFADEINEETLSSAFNTAPNWASQRNRESVRKYANWDKFHKADEFNSQLTEV